MARQVWLLARDGPDPDEGVRGWLVAQALEHRIGGPFFGLIARFWASWWSTRLTLPPVQEAPTALAELLGRVLGEGTACHAVVGQAGLHRVLGGVGKSTQVILVPLTPHGEPALQALTALARQNLQARGASATPIGPLHEHEGYQEAVAEALRARIADLGGAPYTVIFGSARCPRAEAPARALELTRAAVVRRAALVAPHQALWAPSPRQLRRAVHQGSARGARPLLLPLDRTLDATDAWTHLLQRARLDRDLLVPPPGTRPTFVRALADLVGRAEEAAGWAASSS